ncbi:hypothetical protein I79_007187 [Cricetulus griseus]|uniref:Uncharacterized protein n=1 Tax=Cricetulus griseus TaxID=10029 RepID=G3H9V6_CRIGR|nr:hypothetical protein I79_007187 [Cricetulus griseus]
MPAYKSSPLEAAYRIYSKNESGSPAQNTGCIKPAGSLYKQIRIQYLTTTTTKHNWFNIWVFPTLNVLCSLARNLFFSIATLQSSTLHDSA